MSTGVGPQLPESGWHVDHAKAFPAWLSSYAPGLPPSTWMSAVVEWIHACELAGPPAAAVAVAEDRYVAQIPGTRLFAEYLVVEYEFLIIVKDFH